MDRHPIGALEFRVPFQQRYRDVSPSEAITSAVPSGNRKPAAAFQLMRTPRPIDGGALRSQRGDDDRLWSRVASTKAIRSPR